MKQTVILSIIFITYINTAADNIYLKLIHFGFNIVYFMENRNKLSPRKIIMEYLFHLRIFEMFAISTLNSDDDQMIIFSVFSIY